MPTKILFVCLGNICRSPAALAVCQKMCEKQDPWQIAIDSAGTSAFHAGYPPDSRMIAHAKKRGYQLTSRSRQLVEADFFHFDFILAMDSMNMQDIQNLQAKFHPKSPKAKVIQLTDYKKFTNLDEVPDPYYGGEQGFELVLDILEDCIGEFLKKEVFSAQS
jgi:protein-tyrosine phosphatase